MKVDTKWKVFACRHVLSDWKGSAHELFDVMLEASDDEMDDVFQRFEVDVWHPFCIYTSAEVAEIITGLAYDAQKTGAING